MERKKFDLVMERVREYCNQPEVRVSSILRFDFDSFKDLVDFGPEALPYLKGLIGNDGEPRWYVLQACLEILAKDGRGVEIPEEIRGRLPEIENYLIDSLD